MNKNLYLFSLLSILYLNVNVCYSQSAEGIIFDDENEQLNENPISNLEKEFKNNLLINGLHLEKELIYKNFDYFNRPSLKDVIENLNYKEFLSMPILKVGDKGKNVDLLLLAMFHRGLIKEWSEGMSITSEIENIIKLEQKKFGIKDDGIAGPLFYNALYYGSEEIKEHLNVFELWKKTKFEEAQNKGYSNIVVVNIPSYKLSVFETSSGEEVFQTTTVVGALNSKTPTLLTYIVNLKHNPDWSPTPSAKAKGKKYTPAGPNNPLGLMRFSTNNNLNIYLHDTNQKDLFKENFKAKSMGCVRVDDWKNLAAILRRSSVDDMMKVNETRKTIYEKISKTPVYIIYSRADKIGEFPMIFPDVYNKNVYFETPLSFLEEK